MIRTIRYEAQALASISARSCAAFVLTIFAVAANAQDGRCPEREPDVQQSMDELGAVEVCQFIAVTAGESTPELPEAVVVAGPVEGPVVSSPRAGVLRFSIPEQYGEHGICGYSLDRVSALPPFGGFIEHGWENLMNRSIDYGWVLRQRGLGRGNTRLQADLYFSFLPASNLARARQEGLCMQDLIPRSWR